MGSLYRPAAHPATTTLLLLASTLLAAGAEAEHGAEQALLDVLRDAAAEHAARSGMVQHKVPSLLMHGEGSVAALVDATAPALLPFAARAHEQLIQLADHLPTCLGSRLIFEVRGSDADSQVDLSIHASSRELLEPLVTRMARARATGDEDESVCSSRSWALAHTSEVWRSLLLNFSRAWQRSSSPRCLRASACTRLVSGSLVLTPPCCGLCSGRGSRQMPPLARGARCSPSYSPCSWASTRRRVAVCSIPHHIIV
jgi:hypothetical protein